MRCLFGSRVSLDTTLTPIGHYRDNAGSHSIKPVYRFPSISTVTRYSCGCSCGMAGRCGPSLVELPNLRRDSKNLLLGFICRLLPFAKDAALLCLQLFLCKQQ